MSKWQKIPSCSISQEPYIIWLYFLVYVCKMIISWVVFYFFKILVFLVVLFWGWGGIKGQKMVQNDKTICLSCSTFQEQYIWFSFMAACMCKMIISSGLFFSFSKFWFFGLMEVKWQKTVQNDKKFCPSCFISQEQYVMWLSFMVHM